MARSAPRGTEHDSGDTVQFFVGALDVAIDKDEQSERGGKHRAPEQPTRTDLAAAEVAPPVDGRKPYRVAAVAAGGVLLFAVLGAFLLGGDEPVQGSARSAVPSQVPAPPSSETSSSTTTTTTTPPPPPEPTQAPRTRDSEPERAPSVTRTREPEPERKSDRERFEEMVSSVVSEVESRMSEWPGPGGR